MKKRFFVPACVLSALAVGFVIFAMGHPELSFPWDNWVTGILYGLYADVVVLLFILAFCEKMTILNILSIVFVLDAVCLVVLGFRKLSPDGGSNWYMPCASLLNCVAMFLNLAQMRNNRKKDTNDQKE